MPPLMRRPGGPRQLSVPALACIVGTALVLALCLLAARWPPHGAGACQRPPPEGAPRIHRVPYTLGSSSSSSNGSAATNGHSSGGSAGRGGAAGGGPGVGVGGAVREDRCFPLSCCQSTALLGRLVDMPMLSWTSVAIAEGWRCSHATSLLSSQGNHTQSTGCRAMMRMGAPLKKTTVGRRAAVNYRFMREPSLTGTRWC